VTAGVPGRLLTDADVPAWWRALGLPGLLDVHVHFLPDRMREKVWAQFDQAGPLIGREWPIRYRGTDEERLATLRALGVRRFSALSYAHRPGMAEWLNDWAADFADGVPECLRSATFFPEPGVERYVARRVEEGAQIFKVHVQVGGFDLRDPALDRAWGVLAEAAVPVVVHAGSGPVGTEHTGPGPLRGVLGRHPALTAVVAHCGAPEYAEFLDLALEFDRVHLDTAMVFTDFFDQAGEFPAELLAVLRDRPDVVLLGSDFPTIPYDYAHQLEALERLDLGEDWLRAVCWDNAERLLGLDHA
jgi:predicted TIM-barrel fold metal-dependent hydrolase